MAFALEREFINLSLSLFAVMAHSALTVATRALISVILSLARAYEIAVTVNRDSDATAILKGYRRVLLKAHPDQGGRWPLTGALAE